jgi:hypothetical protein
MNGELLDNVTGVRNSLELTKRKKKRKIREKGKVLCNS